MARELIASDRFVVEQWLGEGSMGAVYRAYDRERGHNVALKTLVRADPIALYHFKQEFRSLAGVTHRNLVTLYELVSTGEQWFFTMELIAGAGFLEYMRGAEPPEPTDSWRSKESPTVRGGKAVGKGRVEEVVLETTPTVTSLTAPSSSAPAQLDRLGPGFTQLAEGLNALHNTGHLHRDIKPTNVLVTARDRVVILDFGVVAPVQGSEVGRRYEDPAGTPAYMAPEQSLRGVAPTPACDWYSFGVILYEALTNRRPFVGTVDEILERKRHVDAEPPSRLNPDAPPELCALCEELLRRDPAARPSGEMILDRLRGESAAAVCTPLEVGVGEIDTELIGRQRELGELRAGLESAECGQGAAVFVVGESGMGKSALVQRFLREVARDEETVILCGRCHEGENVPYKAVDSLVDSLCQYLISLPRHEAESRLPLDVRALARVFPVLRRVESVSDARRRAADVALDPMELRERAFAALRELLARIAARSPLVLFIDDLQWGDVDSAPLLADLMKPPAPPFLLIGAYRSEDAEGGPLLRALFDDDSETALRAERRRVVRVSRLPLPQARTLAGRLLDEAGARPELDETIARESHGNPFFIHQLVRFAATPGASSAPGKMTIEAVLEARLAVLPKGSRHLLEVISVAGAPTPQDVIRRAAQLGEAEPQAFAELRSGRWIRSAGTGGADRVETYHDRIRETVVGSIEPDRRADLHLRIAKSYEAAEQPDPRALAAHFHAAGERERALEYAVLAGDQAAAALAFEAAAELYFLAHELLADDERAAPARRELQIKLGDALTNAGRGQDAAPYYLEAAGTAESSLALDLRRNAAFQLLRSGRIDEGVAVLGTVMSGYGYRLTTTPRRVLGSLLAQRLRLRLRGLRVRLRSTEQIPAGELQRIDACWTAAVGLAAADTIRGADFGTRLLLRALRAGDPLRVARGLLVEAGFVATRGVSARGRVQAILGRVRPIAAELDDPAVNGWLLGIESLAHYQAGEHRASLEFSERSLEVLRTQTTGTEWERDLVEHCRVWSMFYLGQLSELASAVPQIITEARRRGDLFAAAGMQTGLPNVVFLMRDEPALARRQSDDAMSIWSRERFLIQHCWNIYARAQCDLYEGHGRAAVEHIEEQWPALERSLLLRIQILRVELVNLRGRAALAAAVDDTNPEPLLRKAERAAKKTAREQISVGPPLAALLRAGVARARSDESAVESMKDAQRTCAAAGFPLFEQVAKRRVGQWMGNEEGERLVAEADAWMRERAIANPAGFTALFEPSSR